MKIKGFWRFFLIAILSAVFLLPIIKNFSAETLVVKINLETATNVDYQIFYLDSADKSFNESMSIPLKLERKGDDYFIEAKLPVKTLMGLRLDFGQCPGQVVLRSVELNGEKKIKFNGERLKDSVMNMLDVVDFKDGQLIIESAQIDPFIIFPQNLLQNNAKIHYDWLPIISAYILIYSFLYCIIRYLSEIKSKYRTINIIFLVLAILLLILPITKINHNEVDSLENRTLALKPSLIQNGTVNLEYGKQFAVFLNDRFRFREKLINIHDKVEAIMLGKIENDKAFVGKDHWIFYKAEGSALLYQNKLLFTMEEMEQIKNNLNDRKSWLAKQGIKLFVMVPPDKESVYGEFYKEGVVQIGSKNRMQILQEYLAANESGIKINYLLDLMVSHKDDGLLYYKTDTHWNEYGAYIGYLSLMKDIQKEFSDIKVLSKEDMEFKYVAKSSGDLVNMLKIENTEAYSENYISLLPKDGYHFTYLKNEHKDGIITKNPNKSLKVLVFRDSFATSLTPYLSETFGQVEYIWSYDFNAYQDKIVKENPDIVIHEVVSRYVNCFLLNTPKLKEVAK